MGWYHSSVFKNGHVTKIITHSELERGLSLRDVLLSCNAPLDLFKKEVFTFNFNSLNTFNPPT